MSVDTEQVGRYFNLLKDLYNHSGEVFSISKALTRYKCNPSTSAVLKEEDIIKAEKTGAYNKVRYTWNRDIVPNVKMAERLYEEVLKYLKTDKSKPKTGTSPFPTTEIQTRIKELEEEKPTKSKYKTVQKQIAEEDNYSKALDVIRGLLENEIAQFFDEKKNKEIERQVESLSDTYESQLEITDKVIERQQEDIEVLKNRCNESGVEFSVLWGLIRYSKFKNQ